MKLADLKNKKVLVWGLGSEGLAAINKIHSLTKFLYYYDDNEINVGDLPATKVNSLFNSRYDICIKSPGVSAYKPEIKQLKKLGTYITTGTQLWFNENLPGKKICISGSKGKSTSVSLLAHILNSFSKPAFAAGNIGLPLLETIDFKNYPEYWILELSSYQIYDLQATCDITLLLNIFETHQDWHQSTNNYQTDKFKLMDLNSKIKILNIQDTISMKLAKSQASYQYFNGKAGFHVNQGRIYYKDQALPIIKNFSLLGEHILTNICGILTILIYLFPDIKPENWFQAIETFQGLPHRLNKILEKEGIIYVDDSISTIPEATVAAIKALAHYDITLIFGGKDLGLDLTKHINNICISNLKAIIGLADTGHNFIDLISSNDEIFKYKAKNLEEAVKVAKEVTRPGGIVLLSPGAQSYNSFKNYIERAERFKAAV